MCKDFTLSVKELKDFIGIMYGRDVTGKNDLPFIELCIENWFDHKSSRLKRLRIDKFGLLSLLWNRLVEINNASY